MDWDALFVNIPQSNIESLTIGIPFWETSYANMPTLTKLVNHINTCTKLKIESLGRLMVSARDLVDVLPLLCPTGPLIEEFEAITIENPTDSECKDFLTVVTNNHNLGLIDFIGSQNNSLFDQTSMVMVLNCNGRNYMAQQNTNRALGVALLATVEDSIESLYFHLQENPILCNVHQT